MDRCPMRCERICVRGSGRGSRLWGSSVLTGCWWRWRPSLSDAGFRST